MQLRTQFADMYSLAAPAHKPCEAQAPHDGFRSTHTNTAAAAEAGMALLLDKALATNGEGETAAAAIATELGDAVVAAAIGTGVGGGLGGAAVAAGVEHAGVQLRTQLTDM